VTDDNEPRQRVSGWSRAGFETTETGRVRDESKTGGGGRCGAHIVQPETTGPETTTKPDFGDCGWNGWDWSTDGIGIKYARFPRFTWDGGKSVDFSDFAEDADGLCR